ncbi:hypothetical protein LY76DRAFT_639993 [Colletotrichum caudatum]|nr:hypothetical protein LY76DRAFT_639993 [Colletotrichum caudatum]
MVCFWKKTSGLNSRAEDAAYAVFDGVRYYKEHVDVPERLRTRWFRITNEEDFTYALRNASRRFGNNANVGNAFYIREGTSVNAKLGTPGCRSDFGVVQFGAPGQGRRSRAQRRADIESWREGRWRSPNTTSTREGSICSRDKRADDSTSHSESEDESNNGSDGRDEIMGRESRSSKGAGSIKSGQADGERAAGGDKTGGTAGALDEFRRDIRTMDAVAEGLRMMSEAYSSGKIDDGSTLDKAFGAIQAYGTRIKDVVTRIDEAIGKEASSANSLSFLDPENFLAAKEQQPPDDGDGNTSTPLASFIKGIKGGRKRTAEVLTIDDDDVDNEPAPKVRLRSVRSNDNDAVRAQTWQACAGQLANRLTDALGEGAGGDPQLSDLDEDGGTTGLWTLYWNNKVAVAPKAVIYALNRFIEVHLASDNGYKCIPPKFLKSLLRGEVVPIFTPLVCPPEEPKKTTGPKTRKGKAAEAASNASPAPSAATGANQVGVAVSEQSVNKATDYWKDLAAKGQSEVILKTMRIVAVSQLLTTYGGVEYWSRVTRAEVDEKSSTMEVDDAAQYIGLDATELSPSIPALVVENDDDWDD